MLSALIWLIVLITVIAIFWWYVEKVSLPMPLKLLVYALIAIVALVIVARTLPMLGASPGL